MFFHRCEQKCYSDDETCKSSCDGETGAKCLHVSVNKENYTTTSTAIPHVNEIAIKKVNDHDNTHLIEIKHSVNIKSGNNTIVTKKEIKTQILHETEVASTEVPYSNVTLRTGTQEYDHANVETTIDVMKSFSNIPRGKVHSSKIVLTSITTNLSNGALIFNDSSNKTYEHIFTIDTYMLLSLAVPFIFFVILFVFIAIKLLRYKSTRGDTEIITTANPMEISKLAVFSRSIFHTPLPGMFLFHSLLMVNRLMLLSRG